MGTSGRPCKARRTSQSAAGLGQDDIAELRVRSRALPPFLKCDLPPPLSSHPLGQDDDRNINRDDRGGPDTPHSSSAARCDGGCARSTDGSNAVGVRTSARQAALLRTPTGGIVHGRANCAGLCGLVAAGHGVAGDHGDAGCGVGAAWGGGATPPPPFPPQFLCDGRGRLGQPRR